MLRVCLRCYEYDGVLKSRREYDTSKVSENRLKSNEGFVRVAQNFQTWYIEVGAFSSGGRPISLFIACTVTRNREYDIARVRTV